MSEVFEKSIQEWYDKSRVAGLEYLNLDFPKYTQLITKESIPFYCFHKTKVQHVSYSENSHLNFVSDNLCSLENNISKTFDQINLGNKVNFKHFHQIHQTLVKQENCLEVIKKNQNQILNKLSQITIGLEDHKPLTAKQVKELVEQIAQQPKLVEAEALRLTENLEKQVNRVTKLAEEIKHFLTT